MRCLTSLVYRWRQSGTELLPPRSPSEVITAFAAAGIAATPDVVALYGEVGGMPVMDDAYWCLWSLEEVTERNTVTSPWGALFSDFLIDCWCYRLRPNDATTSSVL